MRPMLAALIATAAIAIVAAVFAIWPAVADAPWEDSPPVEDGTDTIRCEGALALRANVVAGYLAASSGPQPVGIRGRPLPVEPLPLGDTMPPPFQDQLEEAEAEIARYC